MNGIMRLFQQQTCSVQTESVAEKIAPIAAIMIDQKEMRLHMVTPLFIGSASCGSRNDGLPRKSPTSNVPMFILLNIAIAPEI
jgi:hypothetical protein